LGNASDEVKARAKHSVKHNDGNGLVEALDHVTYNFLGVKDGIQDFGK
jgi:hydroxymethylpyrimidine pyrophosphatase-like HAD family hydrolase